MGSPDVRAEPASDERGGAGGERAGDPQPRVANVGLLLEGHRYETEVEGSHLAVGFAAEHDRRRAQPEPGEVDTEGVRSSSSLGWRRRPLRTAGTGVCPRIVSWLRLTTTSTPAPSIVLGWGSVSTPGPNSTSRRGHARSPDAPRHRCARRHPGRRGGSGATRSRPAPARRGVEPAVLANARTPIPSSGASTMSVRNPFQMPS